LDLPVLPAAALEPSLDSLLHRRVLDVVNDARAKVRVEGLAIGQHLASFLGDRVRIDDFYNWLWIFGMLLYSLGEASSENLWFRSVSW